MNIKFKKGTYRFALVLGPLTFKMVYFRWYFFRHVFHFIGKKDYFKHLAISWKSYRFRIIRGLFANITEFFTWKTIKAPFLAPTYFSCGFFNIQKTIVGESEEDSFEIAKKILEGLPLDRRETWRLIEGHTFLDNSGWVKTKTGYVLFDYGDCFINGYPFSNVLVRDREELEKILSHT